MTLVTNCNFEAVLPNIESFLANAAFIAFDTEFTGLVINSDSKPSLFDTPEVRYKKLRQSASHFIICQFGLVPFIYDKQTNCYKAHRFSFYICPQSSLNFNSHFSFQSSALEFLCLHDFDFNKFAYEGISYLNKSDEKLLRESFADGSALLSVYEEMDHRLVQERLSAVSAWLAKATDGDTLILEKGKITQLQCYVLLVELRKTFPEIWASSVDNGRILIEKVKPEMRSDLEKQCHDEALLIDSLIGFSRLFQSLVKCKKPLVGHNIFMDLLMLFHHFHHPLPNSFKKFKEELQQLFPVIYDTKHIYQQNQNLAKEKTIGPLLSLSSLYEFFSSPLLNSITLYYPRVEDIYHTKTTQDSFHEAGYDAYAAGFVFVRLLHIIASSERSFSELRPLLWLELKNASQPYENKVNLIRGGCHYVNLSGSDPPTHRPQWLHITAKHSRSLNLLELSQTLSKFGAVDIKLLSPYTAIVAAGNEYTSRDIKHALSDSRNLSVSKYGFFKHDSHARHLLWLIFLATGFFSGFMLYKLRS